MEELIKALKEKLGDSFTEELATEFQASFEVMVNEKVQELLTAKETEIEEKAAEEMVDFKESLIESIDSYVQYAAEEYLKENELAIEAGIKVTAAEQIIEAAKDVFKVVGLEIPETEVDKVKELEAELEESQNRLNESIEKEIDSKAEKFELEKAVSFQKATSDLTESKVEDVLNLLEGLEYKDIDDFDRKVKIVMEKVTVAKTETEEEINEKLEDIIEDTKVSSIDKYLV